MDASSTFLTPSSDHYRHTLTLNPALFRFLNYDITRMSQEIGQAWNNESEQEKRKYEIQALREKEAMGLKGFPDFQYTKSSAFGTTGGGNGGDESLSQDMGRASLGDRTLKKARPKDDAPPPDSLA
ncbi:MAG: hypothetical protein JOS17DRAFT_790417 [Linnemannia elongata]|nr:MAG: hypothetical protein JOS17DRAFT_790417 [Linnemannia elongata]